MTSTPQRQLSDLLNDDAVRVSVCCVCATPRTVKSTYYPRGRYATEGDPPERIAKMQHGRRSPYWQDREPYIRCLELLRCATCKKTTDHAMIRPEGPRDDPAEGSAPGTPEQRDLREMVEHMIDFGIAVFFGSSPPGGTVEIRRYTDAVEIKGHVGRFVHVVVIEKRLDVYHQLKALRWAWRYICPGQSWREATVIHERDNGGGYTGIYQLPDGAR